MAYSDFSFEKIETTLKLTITEADLYSSVSPIEVSHLLSEVLKENVPLGLTINTEKARSELIIAPILVELRKILDHRVSLFSGIEFNVAPEKGLNGVCDFMVSASPTQIILNGPVIQIVEAKNENIKSGIPQCIAEMFAAQIFNTHKQLSLPAVYGVVTIGSSWRFMELRGNRVTIDSMEYFVDNVGKILGILCYMANELLNKQLESN
ncbi:MAG: hypothetical protein ACFB14_18280 [Leptolyngbyaceae cyanobacterium]